MEWARLKAHPCSLIFIFNHMNIEKLALVSHIKHNKCDACKTHNTHIEREKPIELQRPSEIASKTYSILCPIKFDQPKNWLGHGKLSIKSSFLNNVSIQTNVVHTSIMYRWMKSASSFVSLAKLRKNKLEQKTN